MDHKTINQEINHCLNNRRKEEKYFGSEFQLRGAVSGTTSIPRALEKRRFRLERFQLCIELSWCQPYTCCAISVLARTAGSMFTVVMLKTREKVNTNTPKYSPFLNSHHLISFIKDFQQFLNWKCWFFKVHSNKRCGRTFFNLVPTYKLGAYNTRFLTQFSFELILLYEFASELGADQSVYWCTFYRAWISFNFSLFFITFKLRQFQLLY